MPPKMIIEIPLPMPYWLISSPIQMSSIVPAVIVIMIESVPSGFTSKPKLKMIGSLARWRSGAAACRTPAPARAAPSASASSG